MTNASHFRFAGSGLLALFTVCTPSVAVSSAIQTTSTSLAFIPGGQDVHNFLQNVDAEAYVERVVNDGTFTASALTQVNGNLEVGVTLAPRTY